ncbi:MAG TPA: hypothetical protein VGL91_02210 [Acidobacteriota bacterium]|jgi:hypothetical protein
MSAYRKVTVQIRKELLRRAQNSTGEGVTARVRRGLELVAASQAYEKIRQLRGKVNFCVDLKKLREDRA